MSQLVELSCEEMDMVDGGIIPALAYGAFVSGAKWGAGLAVIIMALD